MNYPVYIGYWNHPANIYLFKIKIEMFKVKKKDTRATLTLNIFHIFFSVSFVDFEQVNVCWPQIEKIINAYTLY